MTHPGRGHPVKLEYRYSREPSESELAVLKAYARWTMDYLSLGVAEIDRLEAFKAGARYGASLVPMDPFHA